MTERREGLPPALILGAAVWPGGAPSPTLRRRTDRARRLWQEGHCGALIPCGGTGRHPPAEAEVMARLLREAGVPGDRIHPEAASTRTAENIALALPILRQLGAGPEVWIVTDWYHAPRACLIARRAGLIPRAACPPLRGAKPWPQAKGALRELAALALMLLRRP